jgi:hypothetical protein
MEETMQEAVEGLVRNGALPSDDLATATEVAMIETLLSQVHKPVTDDEAVALVGLFPPAGCFGLEWTLLHLIETAPGWPVDEALRDRQGEWVDTLRERSRRG